jgi:hypothetical protein
MAAARANWKGYLRLSLVSCPIALYPATSESEKVRFHQLHKQTGNRIRYRKVDEETGKEVDSEDIVKAYQISKGITSSSLMKTWKRLRSSPTARSTSTSLSLVMRSMTSTTSDPTTSLRKGRLVRTRS